MLVRIIFGDFLANIVIGGFYNLALRMLKMKQNGGFYIGSC